MAKNVLEKFLTFIGFEDADSEDGDNTEGDAFGGEGEPVRGKRASVVNLHSQKQGKVVLAEPLSFDEVQGIVDHLKNRKSVIVNLDTIDKELAKRMVDFLSGATHALGGNMQKVSSGIFLFAPSNVEISGSMREEINEKFNEHSTDRLSERNLLFWKNK